MTTAHIPSSPSVVIVGGGKMGTAILSGWLSSQAEPARNLGAGNFEVVDPGSERRAHLSETYGVTCVESVRDVSRADLVVLAVKPQVMMGVLEEISQLAAFGGAGANPDSAPLFISIAAGLETARLSQALPALAPLVRVMPNMPLQVGAGASGVCAGATATDEHVAYVTDLFACLGRAVVVAEQDMDAVCALSGSGPAYVAAMIEALRDSSVAAGLDVEVAEALALQTVLGTAMLIDQTDLSPEQARVAVCSPGGTTLAALDAMNEAGFARVFDEGIKAAVKRSRELAGCS